MTDPAEVEAEARGDHLILRVTGEIDVFNATTIATAIEAAVPPDAHGAVIDLTGLEFLDSTAIRQLFGVAARLRERRQGVRIVVTEGSSVARTLGLVEFSRAAPMHTTVDDALDELGADTPTGAQGQVEPA